jgi:hypothetical protein
MHEDSAMDRDFTEADWKYFRRLRKSALDRFCQRVLTDVSELSADPSKNHHERYLAVYRLICDRDRELADTFDDPSRSRAVISLARMRSNRLVTDGEFAEFSDAARASVVSLLDFEQRHGNRR